MADLSDERAFYYVDGIPTKGVWIDLDQITDEDDIKQALADAGLIPTDDDEDDQNTGTPVYDGDLLVATVEGALAPHFLSKYDTFDLGEFKECVEECDSDRIDYDHAAAYINWAGSWSLRNFEDARCGKYDSEVAYAEELFDECYLHDVPESVRYYVDYEKFARDLFMSDYYFDDDTGYVFRSC